MNKLKDRLAGSNIFTTLNLKGVYNLIRIKEGDKWKIVFYIKFRLFKYLVIPFRLINTLVIF